MSEVAVTFVRSPEGDWVGLFVDNTLVTQGHSIQEEDLVRELIAAVPLEGVRLDTTRWDWNPEKDGGHLPDKLSAVTFDGG